MTREQGDDHVEMDRTPARPGTEAGLALAAIGHDLRTPVTSVIALTQLALDAQRRGQGVEDCLMQILAAARTLDSIAGDLTAACTQDTRQETFSGDSLAQALRALAGPPAQARGQRLTIDLQGLGEGGLLGDRAGLERVLLNLLTNAVKYTPEGGSIRLTAQAEPDAPADIQACFVVEDNGMGMKPEFVSRMFQPYVRAPESEGTPGSGLGMTIAKRLVDRMGGCIDVQSRWGKGTRFTVRVPLERTAERPGERSAVPEKPLKGEHILLAEDNALCAQIAVRLLGHAGAQVACAQNGQEAVRRFASVPPGRFSVVLLDLRMPVLDGFGAARAIRALPRADAADVPILALTAGAAQEDEAQARRAGMDACLKKPLEAAVLARKLRSARKRAMEREETATASDFR